LCKHFIRGRCKHGHACDFAHGREELGTERPEPRNNDDEEAEDQEVEDQEAEDQEDEDQEAEDQEDEDQEDEDQEDEDQEEVQDDESRRLKTRLCRFFKKGICKRGQACDFAHGREELGTERPEFGNCDDEEDEVQDDEDDNSRRLKTHLCEYNRLSRCKFGASCRDAHHVDDLLKTNVCVYYASGHCDFGRYCKYLH